MKPFPHFHPFVHSGTGGFIPENGSIFQKKTLLFIGGSFWWFSCAFLLTIIGGVGRRSDMSQLLVEWSLFIFSFAGLSLVN